MVAVTSTSRSIPPAISPSRIQPRRLSSWPRLADAICSGCGRHVTGQASTSTVRHLPRVSPVRCQRRWSSPVHHAGCAWFPSGRSAGRAQHPVRGQTSTRQFGHLDCHAVAAGTVGQACDGGGDHLGVRMGVAAHFVLPPSTLQPSMARCSRTYSRPKPGLPRSRPLAAAAPDCACSRGMPIPAPHHTPSARLTFVPPVRPILSLNAHGCIPSNRDICAGRAAWFDGRQIHGPEAVGSPERERHACAAAQGELRCRAGC